MHGDIHESAATTTDRLYRSLVEDGELLQLAIRPDGTVVFASQGVTRLLGTDPVEVVGTNVLAWLYPDDVERLLLQITAGASVGATRALSRFRLRHTDGSWVPVELWASEVTDGNEELIGITARDGSHQTFLEEIMTMLLSGADRREVLAPVCNTIQWNGAGSRVAIDWFDSQGHHQVNTGMHVSLGGSAPVHDGFDPWAQTRSTAEATEGVAGDLSPGGERLANAVGLERYWIEPVTWSSEFPPATVTVWTVPGRSPSIHAFGMGTAKKIIELIMRWTEQVRVLDQASRVDSLTGLANRRAFFGRLSEWKGGGAVLLCNLDRFKPVNDELGHAAGDELLHLVGGRLKESVRDSDLLARLGGDEFAILCAVDSEQEADEMAERILASLRRPFRTGGRLVTVGISIGVGFNAAGLDEDALDAADAALEVARADRPS
ncbi:MAG: diguanylate cyclase domain-containing protein [Acidimicrobiales bacterium]|jgi:diguanylate cyclase (GGDEF)-like protein/PAS domain S-box-containing protein